MWLSSMKDDLQCSIHEAKSPLPASERSGYARYPNIQYSARQQITEPTGCCTRQHMSSSHNSLDPPAWRRA